MATVAIPAVSVLRILGPKVTIFTLVRDYSNPLVHKYVDNTHTLLTQYHLDTKVWSNTDITPDTVIENVKDDIAMELFE